MLFSNGNLRGCEGNGRRNSAPWCRRRWDWSPVYVNAVALAGTRQGLRSVSSHGAETRQRRPVQGGCYRQHRTDGVGCQKRQGGCRECTVISLLSGIRYKVIVPVTSTFDLLTSKWVLGLHMTRATFLPSLVLVRLVVFELFWWTGRTYRYTLTTTTDRAIYLQGGPKKLTPFVLCALISSNFYRFSNLFTVWIRRTFAIIPSLKIPPHLKCVATLPCEMSVSQKLQLKTRRLL